MIIFPAIDLRRGRCVRLRQGDPDAETVFGEDPAAMARHWANQGAEWLHVVNLDGALGADFDQIESVNPTPKLLIQLSSDSPPKPPHLAAIEKLPINLQRLYEISQAVDLPIQFGGGLRTLDDIELALKLGATRVVLGTVAIEDPDIVSSAIKRWGADKIVVGLDARNGIVATHGWQKASSVTAIDLGHHMRALGVERVVYTDIARDGLLSGVNVEETSRLGDTTDLHVIASGGVHNITDIERLKAHEHYNIEGVVVGQALYTENLDLAEAIALGHEPLRRRSVGYVPYRMGANGPEFLLLFNIFFEQWQFPRGGVKKGETDLECAAREFNEETGLTTRSIYEDCRTVLKYTATIRGYDIDRTIVYFLAEIDPTDEVRLGHENHAEARWFNAEEAWEYLTETSPEQLPALDAAVAFLQEQVS